MSSERFRQRLVGVLVLVALAAIFVPAVFNFNPSRPVDETTQIPPAPDIKEESIPAPVVPEEQAEVIPQDEVFTLVEDTGGDSDSQQQVPAAPRQDVKPTSTAVKEVAPTKQPPAETPKLAGSGLPEAWVIQVASYRESETAEKLSARLQGAGFKAFVRPAMAGAVKVYRVYVGPHVLRQNADKEKARIDASLGVKSLVLPFEP
ncbi:MAG: SPOR domain-containing protein [Porticoccaceae bacterium]|nr:SPOR domain-containing protein [Porticoccaceae bacterium]